MMHRASQGWESSASDLPSCPSPLKTKGFNLKEKEAILHFHNTKRQEILRGISPGLPKAREMKWLKWDDQLEREAQRWIDLCPTPSVKRPEHCILFY